MAWSSAYDDGWADFVKVRKPDEGGAFPGSCDEMVSLNHCGHITRARDQFRNEHANQSLV